MYQIVRYRIVIELLLININCPSLTLNQSHRRQSYASTPSWRGGRAEAKYSLTASAAEAVRGRVLSARCRGEAAGEGREHSAPAAPCARTVAPTETVHERTHETTANYAEVSKLGQFGTTNERR